MKEWLEQQPDRSAASATFALNFCKTIQVNHIVLSARGSSLCMKFTLSEWFGSIAITSTEAKPSFSIIYPGTSKPPLIFAKDNPCTSALFRTISYQEFVIAASRDNIHVWNQARNTSSAAYKVNEENNFPMCVIDDRTIACVTEEPSWNGFSKVYLLNTDTEELTLSSTLLLNAIGRITDICYVQTIDGTACLILSFPYDSLLQSVEMIGGKVRWQANGSSCPSSICTDGSTIFAVDAVGNKLDLLSVEDGSSITSIRLRPFDVRFPTCVRLQREHLYIGHMNKKQDTYCISKFTKPIVG